MLVFGVLLAVVAFGGVIIFGAGSGSAQPAAPTTVKVVTAAANVTLGTALDLPQLGTIDMEVALAVDTYTDPNQLVGKVVRRTVLQGEAFKSTDFQAAVGLSPVDVTSSLKAGQVAIAINVDQVTGVGGLIQAGDYVDDPTDRSARGAKAPVGPAGQGSGHRLPLDRGPLGDVLTTTRPSRCSSRTSRCSASSAPPRPSQHVSIQRDRRQRRSRDRSQHRRPDCHRKARDPERHPAAGRTGPLRPDRRQPVAPPRSPADAASADVKTTGVTLRELVDHYGVLPPRVIYTTP